MCSSHALLSLAQSRATVVAARARRPAPETGHAQPFVAPVRIGAAAVCALPARRPRPPAGRAPVPNTPQLALAAREALIALRPLPPADLPAPTTNALHVLAAALPRSFAFCVDFPARLLRLRCRNDAFRIRRILHDTGSVEKKIGGSFFD